MCEPIVAPTEEGKKHRTRLIVVGFVHLILAILLCFIMFTNGIFELINVAILFCALAQMNYCCLIIYIINISIDFFTLFNQIGLLIQTGTATEIMTESSLGSQFALTVMIILCVFYLVATVVCFYAYREFKGMLFDAGQGGGFGMGSMMGGGQQQAQAQAQEPRGSSSAAQAS